jgi:hypothetical protein
MENLVEIECWLKDDNITWHYATKNLNYLSHWDNVELLSRTFYGDLFYAWMDGKKDNGVLFKGKWNSGKYL